MSHDCVGDKCICHDEARMKAMLDIALSGLAKRGEADAPILTEDQLEERVHTALPYLKDQA